MFIFGNLFLAMAKIVDVLLTMAYWLILIRALISWVNPDPFNPIVQFLHRATDPLLNPIRRFLPTMPIDISPIIVFLIIVFIKEFLVNTLVEFGMRMR